MSKHTFISKILDTSCARGSARVAFDGRHLPFICQLWNSNKIEVNNFSGCFITDGVISQNTYKKHILRDVESPPLQRRLKTLTGRCKYFCENC